MSTTTKTTRARGLKRSREREEEKEDEVGVDEGSSCCGSGVLHFLTCQQGGSDKFYEIRVSGTDVLCRHGRTGKGTTVLIYNSLAWSNR
jgi:hypothetical protein